MNLWVMILTVMPKKTKKLCLTSLLTMNNLQLLFYLVLMTRISKISKTKLMHQFSQIKVILESLQMVIKFLISSWTAILKKTTFSHHSLKISQFIQSVSIPECLEKLLEWATIQLLKTWSKLLKNWDKVNKLRRKKCLFIYHVKSFLSYLLKILSLKNSLIIWLLVQTMFLTSVLNAYSLCLPRILSPVEIYMKLSLRDSENRKEVQDSDISW